MKSRTKKTLLLILVLLLLLITFLAYRSTMVAPKSVISTAAPTPAPAEKIVPQEVKSFPPARQVPAATAPVQKREQAVVKSSPPAQQVPAAAAPVQEIDCLKCHAKLKSNKVVHPALDMGCPTCHTGIDAKTVPHTKTNNTARGLSGEQPDLCYGCHDKAMFSKKNVHAAVGMGCTSCHSPHSSANAKLLTAEAPDLCFSCHDKAMFSQKNTHSPVEGGMCLSCHSPHSSDNMALLLKVPVEVCLECHPDVPKRLHALAAFTTSTHPVGVPKKAPKEESKEKAEKEAKKELVLMDPSRPDKVFYCGSCHNPHSTSGPRLLRFNVGSTMGLCRNCHKH
jgi:predicted CXXCH cytochrome family protein